VLAIHQRLPAVWTPTAPQSPLFLAARTLSDEKTISVRSHIPFSTKLPWIWSITPSSRLTIAWYCRRQE
jgi:hypothetical protein